MENKKIDHNLILQAVTSYLVGAKDFFGNNKNNFSVGLIPDGHHIYTGTLKAAGYRLLRPNKTLVLIGEGAIDHQISILEKPIELFMAKKWNLDEKILGILKKYDFVKSVEYKFDWIDSELPFLRIISQYDNVIFLEIGESVPELKLINLLSKISQDANLLFISDFHRDKPIKVCKDMDSKILDINFVKKDQDLFLIKIFLKLAGKAKKKPELLAYLNTGDISTDKKITNGFGSIFF